MLNLFLRMSYSEEGIEFFKRSKPKKDCCKFSFRFAVTRTVQFTHERKVIGRVTKVPGVDGEVEVDVVDFLSETFAKISVAQFTHNNDLRNLVIHAFYEHGERVGGKTDAFICERYPKLLQSTSPTHSDLLIAGGLMQGCFVFYSDGSYEQTTKLVVKAGGLLSVQ